MFENKKEDEKKEDDPEKKKMNSLSNYWKIKKKKLLREFIDAVSVTSKPLMKQKEMNFAFVVFAVEENNGLCVSIFCYYIHNSLKLSFVNIWGLPSNFVECEYFLESNSPDILALCETNLDDSIDSGNFSVRGYLPLIWKDSITLMHGLAVYVK